MSGNALFTHDNVMIQHLVFSLDFLFLYSLYSISNFLNETKILVFGSLKIFQINTKLSRGSKTCPSIPTRVTKTLCLSKINFHQKFKSNFDYFNKELKPEMSFKNKHGTWFQWIFGWTFTLNWLSFSYYLFLFSHLWTWVYEEGSTR